MWLASFIGWFILCANLSSFAASPALPHVCVPFNQAHQFSTQGEAEANKQPGERVTSLAGNH